MILHHEVRYTKRKTHKTTRVIIEDKKIAKLTKKKKKTLKTHRMEIALKEKTSMNPSMEALSHLKQ